MPALSLYQMPELKSHPKPSL